MSQVSVLILTKNEETDIQGCLESVNFSNDIWVLDSESTDKTRDIASQMGANVVIRRFDGYASQRNYGLKEISYKNSWLLILDADERIPKALKEEILAFATSDQPSAAGRIRRRDIFMGRWIKHAQASPYYIRLVRPETALYEREVNEVLKVDGTIADLTEPFDHYPFSKGIAHWIDKHNVYSTMEAKELVKIRSNHVSAFSAKGLFQRDFNDRRAYQKMLFYRLPCRPILKFLILYVIKRGFLDGKPGFHYSVLQSVYEYFIELKAIAQKP